MSEYMSKIMIITKFKKTKSKILTQNFRALNKVVNSQDETKKEKSDAQKQ